MPPHRLILRRRIQNLVETFSKEMPIHGMTMTRTTTYDYRLCGMKKGLNPLRDAFREMGLLGCRSFEKHIPKEYLLARTEHRIALLQGLMDTDGTVWRQKGRSARLQFFTISQQLASDFQWLVQSLGNCKRKRKGS